MRILVISDYSRGGAGCVAKETGDLLSSQGHEVKYLWGNKHFSFSPFRYIFNYKANKILRKVLADFLPEIIMVHNYDNLLSPSILSVIKKYRKETKSSVIMTLHDYHVLCPSNSLSYYRGSKKYFFNFVPTVQKCFFTRIDYRSWAHSYLRVLQWLIYYKFFRYRSAFDFFIAPSEFMFEKSSQVLDKKKLKLIRNPTVITAVGNSRAKVKDNSALTITYAGRLSDEKGILYFVRALANLRSYITPKIHLNIIGDGAHERLIEKVVKCNTNDNLTFKLFGRKSKQEVETVFQKSDFVVLPSLCYENAPLTLVEAAMLGCRIITMNYGGMKEIAEMQNGSFLMNSFSRIEIQRLLKFLSEEREFAVDNSEIVSRFSKESYLSMILDTIPSRK
ncbi:glycosyltransferase [Idiomarina sp. PL1-037]|uniref:glycosyltransferase n=1 Tax=Idiomarina sp. PL1-037 TaxID=3095365 RepID=UPI002ACBEF51|nr:glycosyltransferase [Idiomarina sp. PL1-037]WQC53502.1 glycosyltransferase [Idiomarina sp. PL1-037]